MEALITAVRDVEKEVVGIGKIAVRHAEDSTGGAGEARLRKIALKVHGVAMSALGAGLYGEEMIRMRSR